MREPATRCCSGPCRGHRRPAFWVTACQIAGKHRHALCAACAEKASGAAGCPMCALPGKEDRKAKVPPPSESDPDPDPEPAAKRRKRQPSTTTVAAAAACPVCGSDGNGCLWISIPCYHACCLECFAKGRHGTCPAQGCKTRLSELRKIRNLR